MTQPNPNWKILRQEAVSTVVLLARRGTNITAAAEHIARLHYQGKSKPHAVGHLVKDALSLFMEKHGGWTEEQDRINKMARQLESEGWKAIYDGNGYMWRHTTHHVDVNNGGGTFDTYTAATQQAYESQTRQLLLS
jgi:regulatory protein YycH of two-component signal transduction system YycFG